MYQVIVPQTYEIGSKVEYYSDTMNGWVLSYVKGLNSDGTYRLNTKKSANPGRLRPLLVQPDATKPVPRSRKEEVKEIRPLLVSAPVRTVVIRAAPVEPVTTTIRSRQPVTTKPVVVHTISPVLSSSPVSSFLCPIPLKRQITAQLDLLQYTRELTLGLSLPPDTVLTRMQGFTGGQNEGIYFLSSPRGLKFFCLKVVKSSRKFAPVPSESENYVSLLSRFPSIIHDDSIAFPRKIVQLTPASGSALTPSAAFDVIVMPVAPGERMAEVLSRAKENLAQLRDIFTAVGKALQRFHRNYPGCQHGDLQTSNIFVQLGQTVAGQTLAGQTLAGQTVSVVLIDVGGMGMTAITKSDLEYFRESIQLLAKTYGPEFDRVASAAFFQAYAS